MDESTVAVSATAGQADIVVLDVADYGYESFSYIIDRRAHLCFFRNFWSGLDEAGLSLVPVSCERLREASAEAASQISWIDGDGTAVTEPAPTGPARLDGAPAPEPAQ